MNRITQGRIWLMCLVVLSMLSAFKQPRVVEVETVFYPDLQVFLEYDNLSREVHFSGSGTETSRFDIRLLDLASNELWHSSVEYGFAYAYPIDLTAFDEEVFIIEIASDHRKVESMILSPRK